MILIKTILPFIKEKILAKIYVQYFGNSMTSGEGNSIAHC